MTDVARLAGVSQKTVSRVINNAPNVSAEVRDRVIAAVEALGYRRNSAARALVTQRTHVIGIVTPGQRSTDHPPSSSAWSGPRGRPGTPW